MTEIKFDRTKARQSIKEIKDLKEFIEMRLQSEISKVVSEIHGKFGVTPSGIWIDLLEVTSSGDDIKSFTPGRAYVSLDHLVDLN